MFKWNKLLLLLDIWWAQNNYHNEPLWPFIIRKTIIDKKRQILIDNKQCLCEHGGLHQMISGKGKYIPSSVQNHMKETLVKKLRISECVGIRFNWIYSSFH